MKLKIARRSTQILTIAMMFIVPLLNKREINLINGTLYSFNIGPISVTDPLSGLQTLILTLNLSAAFIISILIPIAAAFIFGRVFCGWMCPQNTLSEITDFITEKLGIKRFSKGALSPIPRYIVLGALLIMTPILGFPAANLISAPGILSVQSSRLVSEGSVGIDLALIGIILVLEAFIIRRIWCNNICPIGGLLGIFRTKKTMKVVFKEDEGHICGGCLECARSCRLGLNPVEGRVYPLCHNCGDCIEACDGITKEKRPLSFRF